MELVKVCAFALMGVLLALQFKGGKQEYGIYLGAAIGGCGIFLHPFLYGTGKKTADGIMAAAFRRAKLSDTSV